ncbi:MAG TPA: hypothetical protein VGB26_06715 [Nitrospiria bacterium]|jgi:uncharacterized protein YutE (UPF0331/DUF86 family)
MLTNDSLVKADRFTAIMQKIGFAIWQLQELEWATAHYLTLCLHAKRGIGQEKGAALLEAAGRGTFGSLLNELSKSGILASELAKRLNAALDDRNWLVHRSRRENRGVLNSDKQCAILIAKLERISAEALSLLKEVGQLIERYALDSGVSKEFVDREAERLLIQWGTLE